jgi:Xaa-Pro aminopeptidase
MEIQGQTFTGSISTQELERRWREVRERMREEKIDFLLMQNDNEFNGGYVKYFTDIAAKGGSPFTVIFPLDDEMTTISHGGKPPGDFGPPASIMRGVKKRLTAPYFRSLTYTQTYDAQLAVEAIGNKTDGKIGIVGKSNVSMAFFDYLQKNLPRATCVDATDFVDEIKAVKSDEEIKLIRETAALQDEVIAYAKKIIQPGKKESEIVADLIHKATYLGSQEQLVMAGSGPVGAPVPIRRRQFQNRVVQEGDQFSLLVEVNGPAGMYTEIGRTFFLGRVPSELSDANELCKEAQEVTLKRLKPGANPGELLRANNDFLVKKGFFPETRLYAHGQGYDLVERPALREDEPMKLKARMNITVHPVAATSKLWVWVCDNYLITDSGVSECLHKTPKEILPV